MRSSCLWACSSVTMTRSRAWCARRACSRGRFHGLFRPRSGWLLAQKVAGLAAYLVLVPRPIKVLEDFSSAPPGQVPSLALVDRVSDGEEFGAVVLIAGCDQLGSDECRLTVTFAVLRPDGTPYTGGTNLSRPAEPPLAGTGSRPATSFLKLKLSVHDPRGLYQVSAKVSDATRGITLDLKTSVLLEESLPAASARPN